MATLSKPKIRIKASDLKQAILKKNRALESRNKALGSSLKDKEKELKSLEKEYNSETKKLVSLSKDVQFEEERVQKIKSGVFSNEKLLAEKLKKVNKAEQELCEYESTVAKLEDKEKKLLDKIVILELYKSKCEDAKAELSSIHVKKDNLLDESKTFVKYEGNQPSFLSGKTEYNYSEILAILNDMDGEWCNRDKKD